MSKKQKQTSILKEAATLKYKIIFTLIIIACVAILAILGIAIVGANSKRIVQQYNTLGNKPDNSKVQFSTKYIVITQKADGSYSLEFRMPNSIHDSIPGGISDHDPGTPDTDGDGIPDPIDPDPDDPTVPAQCICSTLCTNPHDADAANCEWCKVDHTLCQAGQTPQPQPPIPGSDDLRDVMAKVKGEAGSEEGYLAVLCNVGLRTGWSTDPAAWLSVISAPNQYEGYAASATYNDLSASQKAAVERYLNGDRNHTFGWMFVGPAGRYNIYGRLGEQVYRVGPGDNYYCAKTQPGHNKTTRAMQRDDDSFVDEHGDTYYKIYDISERTEYHLGNAGGSGITTVIR